MTSDNDQQVSFCPGFQDGSRTKQEKQEGRSLRQEVIKGDCVRKTSENQETSGEAKNSEETAIEDTHEREETVMSLLVSRSSIASRHILHASPPSNCPVIPLSISLHRPLASRALLSLLLLTTRPGVVWFCLSWGRPATKGKEEACFSKVVVLVQKGGLVSTYFPAADAQEEAQHIRLLALLELFDVLEGTHCDCRVRKANDMK